MLTGHRGQSEPLTFADHEHSTVAWFCLRSQPKRESVVERFLASLDGVQVFNPRMRFARATRRGPVEVMESMFPNYLFARFDWTLSLNRVHYAPGVAGVVHFGDKWPTVPDEAIEQLRAGLNAQGAQAVSREPRVGEEVELVERPFHGLNAVITRVMPGSQRITVLMEFLGRQTAVEVGMNAIVRRAGG